MQLASLPEK
jgi:hypothetical protein